MRKDKSEKFMHLGVLTTRYQIAALRRQAREQCTSISNLIRMLFHNNGYPLTPQKQEKGSKNV